MNEEEYSQSTAELIDGEVARIIGEQYTKALELLKGKRDVLDRAAKVLLEKEKIEGDDLKAIMTAKSQGNDDSAEKDKAS